MKIIFFSRLRLSDCSAFVAENTISWMHVTNILGRLSLMCGHISYRIRLLLCSETALGTCIDNILQISEQIQIYELGMSAIFLIS